MSDMIRKYYPVAKVADDPDSFFMTTIDPDLEGDEVVPDGMAFDYFIRAGAPVLYGHNMLGVTGSHGLPVASVKTMEVLPGKGIKAHGLDWLKDPRPPLAQWVESAWKQRKLRGASIGFMSVKSMPSRAGGRRHVESILAELSLVPLPMNPQCFQSVEDRDMILRSLGFGDEAESKKLISIPSILRVTGPMPFDPDVEARKQLREETITALDAHSPQSVDGRLHAEKTNEVTRPDGSRLIAIVDDEPESTEEREPIRWNRQLSDAFDVADQHYEPATVEYGVVARYLGCEVKELYQGGTEVPSPRMGSFLAALEETLGEWRVDDLRNLTLEGTEAPPRHEVIKLNSRETRDFLVHGIRFMRGQQAKMVLKVRETWFGLAVTTYSRDVDSAVTRDFVNRTWRRAGELNFLKGEAFALSGEFLEKSGESWGDLFLSEKNQEPLKRAVDLINSKGANTTNRGILMLGEPGTGKTLAARVMMNEAKSTFIWVSARDFYRAGAFGGIAYGFELAKECAPSILVFEDIDNWLGPTTIDLLKTEMDGVSRSAGVITVLTTNYPERLPDALIDRPGRFHDVLHFSLPDDAARTKMLAKWLPDLPSTHLATAVKATEGYSGAHVRELATFVRTIREQDGLEIGAALDKALTKLREQRELINAVQTADSRYRPTKAVQEMITKTADGVTITKSVLPLNLKMPMPDDMPRDRMPMAECVGRAHEYVARAIGAMAEGQAQCHAAGEMDMATEMGACEEDMMAMCSRMGQMMKAMRKPEDMDEPHKPMMTEYSTDPANLVTKQGNTLNKANRTKLRNAAQAISEVLASARAPEDTPEPETESVPAETMAFDLGQLKGMLDEVLAEVRR